LGVRLKCRRGKRWRQPASAELAVVLERRCPEPWSASDQDAACGIDGRERTNGIAVRALRRGRAQSSLAVDGGRAGAGADAAERKVETGRRHRRIAKLAVGRVAAPFLVAAV